MQLPSIPDNIYKIFLSISVVILFYCIIERKDSQSSVRSYILESRKELNEKLSITSDLKALQRQILWISADLAVRHGIEPFVSEVDSTLIYRDLSGLTRLEDSLFTEIRGKIIDYEGLAASAEDLTMLADSDRKIVEIMTESYSIDDKFLNGLNIIGSILFLYSVIKLGRRSDRIDQIMLTALEDDQRKKASE